MAAASPVPVRETDDEKETSTRTYGSDEGKAAGMSETNWTRNADGEFVRWNEPPHYVDGLLTLTLPGEDIVSHAELSKRRGEYVKLCWHDIHKRRAAR